MEWGRAHIRVKQEDLPGRFWIVVADADADSANLLAAYLLHQRFRTYPTTRGAEALDVAARHPLGLAVIDVQLADMAGRDLVVRLRAVDADLAVVMTTADFHGAIEREARQLGIVQYVQKPFDFRRLELVARRVFALRSHVVAGASRSDR